MMKNRKFLWLTPLLLFVVIFTAGFDGGCDGSYTKERDIVDKQQDVYLKGQPVPFYNFSVPRDVRIQMYNAEMKGVNTYTYERNAYTGKVMASCLSYGYPIPANTQLTNPVRVASNGTAVIDQPEPDGLYSSPSTKGTKVICIDKNGRGRIRYFEGDVEAYPTPMKEVNGELVEVEGTEPSFTIDLHQGQAKEIPAPTGTPQH